MTHFQRECHVKLQMPMRFPQTQVKCCIITFGIILNLAGIRSVSATLNAASCCIQPFEMMLHTERWLGKYKVIKMLKLAAVRISGYFLASAVLKPLKPKANVGFAAHFNRWMPDELLRDVLQFFKQIVDGA